MNNVGMSFETFYNENILEYFKTLQESPFKLISLLIDIGIVLFLLYYAVKAVKGSRAWHLLKGIALFILITILSGVLNLKILNSILGCYSNNCNIPTRAKTCIRTTWNKQVYQIFWNRKRCCNKNKRRYI